MLHTITRPVLLLDREKCMSNIRFMVKKAKKHRLLFRPHFKTHQSAGIAHWFSKEGVTAITVSSVKMAMYFAAHGWHDITIAFPVNIREIADIERLAGSISLNLLVGSAETVNYLRANLVSATGIFIEIDCGSHRSGVQADDIENIKNIIGAIHRSPALTFRGFLTHAGHTYCAKERDDVIHIHRQSLDMMMLLKDAFSEHKPLISTGDTPSCSVSDDFTGTDEIRPGNFVFYDMMQAGIGSCSTNEIAVALVCPVVAAYPGRSGYIIHGGAIHLSKDFIKSSGGLISFGRIARLTENGWQVLPEGNELISVSQEHGVVKLLPEFFHHFSPGGLMAVIPVHSCLTAHQMKQYLTLDGETISMMNDID